VSYEIILANGDVRTCGRADAGDGGHLYVWMDEYPTGLFDFCLSPNAYLAFRDLRIVHPVTQDEIDRAFGRIV
jgi:hypothetical protein